MELSKSRWAWHHNTLHHPYTSCQLCLVLCYLCIYVAGLWKAVGWVVLVCSACWCAWRVSYVVGGCKLIATEHGRCCLSCMWSSWAVLCLYGMLDCQLCWEFLLLLYMAHMVVLNVKGACTFIQLKNQFFLKKKFSWFLIVLWPTMAKRRKTEFRNSCSFCFFSKQTKKQIQNYVFIFPFSEGNKEGIQIMHSFFLFLKKA